MSVGRSERVELEGPSPHLRPVNSTNPDSIGVSIVETRLIPSKTHSSYRRLGQSASRERTNSNLKHEPPSTNQPAALPHRGINSCTAAFTCSARADATDRSPHSHPHPHPLACHSRPGPISFATRSSRSSRPSSVNGDLPSSANRPSFRYLSQSDLNTQFFTI